MLAKPPWPARFCFGHGSTLPARMLSAPDQRREGSSSHLIAARVGKVIERMHEVSTLETAKSLTESPAKAAE